MEKKTPMAYRFIKRMVRRLSPKYEIRGAESLPQEPCAIVGNHCQMYGPIAGELYVPRAHYVWCAGEMMNRGEVAAYAYKDFWSGKPKGTRWFYKLLSHMITPLAVLIFNSAHTVAVYHDSRLISTFRDSMKRLDEGNDLVIFPECYDERNNIVHDFQRRFVDLARVYYKKTGRKLSFVPMYLAPKLGLMCFGERVEFDPLAPIDEERERVCGLLMDRITDIAAGLPEHTVIPYPNIPKRLYPKNIPVEEYAQK